MQQPTLRSFAVKFFTEEGNWRRMRNNTPVFSLRFPGLNHSTNLPRVT